MAEKESLSKLEFTYPKMEKFFPSIEDSKLIDIESFVFMEKEDPSKNQSFFSALDETSTLIIY